MCNSNKSQFNSILLFITYVSEYEEQLLNRFSSESGVNVVDKVEETSKDGGAGWMIGGNVEFCRWNLTDINNSCL